MPPDLPITIAEWPRNSRETVHVRLSLRDEQVADRPYQASLNALFAGMRVSVELTDTFTAARSGKTRVMIGG